MTVTYNTSNLSLNVKPTVLRCKSLHFQPTGSVVIQKTPMATTVVHSGVLGFGDGEKKGLPQTHDAAKLVTNMEI